MLKIDQERFLDITLSELEQVGAVRIKVHYYGFKPNYVNLEFYIGNQRYDCDYTLDGVVWYSMEIRAVWGRLDGIDITPESSYFKRDGVNKYPSAMSNPITVPLDIPLRDIVQGRERWKRIDKE